MNRLSEKEYWDHFYSQLDLSKSYTKILFKDIFSKYLQPGMQTFEIGCYPGRYLYYLSREHGCTVSGIDYTSQFERMVKFLKDQNVSADLLINKDFFDYQQNQKFDFVYSLGFVEHFTNWKDVILLHANFVNEDGYLYISCPNFTGFQYIFHWVFDRENLNRHYIPSMNLREWKKILYLAGFEILESGYYDTLILWTESYPSFPPLERLLRNMIKWSVKLNRKIHFPNKFTSPFMFIVAKRRTSSLRQEK